MSFTLALSCEVEFFLCLIFSGDVFIHNYTTFVVLLSVPENIHSDTAIWYLLYCKLKHAMTVSMFPSPTDMSCLLRMSTIEAFSSRGAKILHYKDASSILPAVFSINVHTDNPVLSLVIKGSTEQPLHSRMLFLCEVEIYGGTFSSTMRRNRTFIYSFFFQ